jgi:hypothetical protein
LAATLRFAAFFVGRFFAAFLVRFFAVATSTSLWGSPQSHRRYCNVASRVKT